MSPPEPQFVLNIHLARHPAAYATWAAKLGQGTRATAQARLSYSSAPIGGTLMITLSSAVTPANALARGDA